MKTTGDKRKSESGIWLEKGLKVAIFWLLQVFGDMGMTKNNKGSITPLYIIIINSIIYYNNIIIS